MRCLLQWASEHGPSIPQASRAWFCAHTVRWTDALRAQERLRELQDLYDNRPRFLDHYARMLLTCSYSACLTLVHELQGNGDRTNHVATLDCWDAFKQVAFSRVSRRDREFLASIVSVTMMYPPIRQ